MDKAQGPQGAGLAALAGVVMLTLLLGGFSAFVGWNKAFAPLEVLREHSAWTIHLPVLVGRIVGWLELASVLALVAALMLPHMARWGLAGASWISANHMVAAVFHIIHAEWHTLTQSAVVIALCALWVWLWLRRVRTLSPSGDNA